MEMTANEQGNRYFVTSIRAN